jgi:hypothetical protein
MEQATTDSAAPLAAKRKELLPHIARLEEARRAFREVLPSARDCIEAVERIEHPSRAILKSTAQELNNYVDSGDNQFDALLKALKHAPAQDFERLAYASDSKIDGTVRLVAGTCAIPGAMERLIKRVSFDMRELGTPEV